MTLTDELQDPKSEKLALLSAMLGITEHKHRVYTGADICIKCGLEVYVDGLYSLEKAHSPCPCPDPITTDLRIIAWQVRDKMVEMGLVAQFECKLEDLPWAYNETPTDWIEAGLAVFKEKKK